MAFFHSNTSKETYYKHRFQSTVWTFRIECPMDSSLPRTWGDRVVDCVWLHQNVGDVEHLIGFVRFRSNMSYRSLDKLCPSGQWFHCRDPLQAVDDILLDEQPFRGPFVIGSKYRLFPYDEENKENVPTVDSKGLPCPYTKKPKLL